MKYHHHNAWVERHFIAMDAFLWPLGLFCIHNLNFLTLQQIYLPNGLLAYQPAIRPSSTMARATVFSQNKGNLVGFTKLLFRRMFTHYTMVLSFILN